MDTGVITSILIGSATLIGWLVTQAQARSKAQREELRNRRQWDLLKQRYIHRLERSLATEDLTLPEKPEGWEQMEMDTW